MQTPTYKELLDAGCHFGHMKRKWNPKMRPFIFMERKGIHVIDLNRTIESLEETAKVMKQMAKSGKKILFVGTKKQARGIVETAARSVNMPFVTDRWLGGMMTNFATIRKSVRKMQSIERMLNDGTLDNITKKERLVLSRKHAKLNRMFGGIADLNRLPNTLFVVDISHEHLAIAEAKRLGISTIGIVDTNSDPTVVDFAVPSNDDASKAIAIVVNYLTEAIREGLEEGKKVKEEKKASAEK
ncbi:30S ribosomal protein S2 [Saprospira grandis]|uniref:Small ribosomal subunit protein uS2 n=1 Tax=Saprospira grandis (strain Lewin) TaxID=984262 RepID=H6L9W9_SAPGL|nr:30S ribosomal protein S2 [Saprospira grandis]AFC24332.1 ribosomal protein S2 [Saprospira grandis str. Lewin]WBM75823.1 30S ribosomal protein S2 [Saprospira grandis]